MNQEHQDYHVILLNKMDEHAVAINTLQHATKALLDTFDALLMHNSHHEANRALIFALRETVVGSISDVFEGVRN